MSENRKACLNQLRDTIGVPVILVTPDNLDRFVLPNHPLHEGYKYLSETHKSDYLRTYFMHFHGGGYCDIKRQSGSWRRAFLSLQSSNAYISGYAEGGETSIACPEVKHAWKELIGNGAYICKPNTPFTRTWYLRTLAFLDIKLEELKQHPSTCPQDCKELGNGYPIEWNELLGRIFHKVCFEFKDRIQRKVPPVYLNDYR
jgi:hypothetical protein